MQSQSPSELKAQRKLEKAKAKIEKLSSCPQEPITVLCVRFGNKYGREYVEKLRNMISRHLSISYEFVCITDDNNPINNVKTIYQKNSLYPKGWWHKIHMFDPALPIKGRILYLDLDVVVHQNIDKLIKLCGTDFYGIRDFNRKFHPGWVMLNSSVMSWIHGSQSHIYEQFMKDKGGAQKLHGDQDWIWKTSKDRIKFWPDPWIQSYKWEIRSREELVDRSGKKGFKIIRNDITPHTECSIAVFHGDPNPLDIHDSFVVENWK